MNLRKNIAALRSSSSNGLNEKKWKRIERQLGFGLPLDYKALIDSHGGSVWQGVELGDQISILSPFARTLHLSVFGLGKDIVEGYREAFESDLSRLPFTYSMELGGLMPWLITSGGDVAYLLVRGDPEFGYLIVLQMSRAMSYEIHNLPCSEFAFRVASRTLASGIVRQTQASREAPAEAG